jgi:hypothetical protein
MSVMNLGQLRYFTVTGATIMRKIAGASIAIAVLCDSHLDLADNPAGDETRRHRAGSGVHRIPVAI